jgi:hypothetical protein
MMMHENRDEIMNAFPVVALHFAPARLCASKTYGRILTVMGWGSHDL